MPYICADCLEEWPCKDKLHEGLGSTKVWMLEQSAWSIACYMFEHERCDDRDGCPCSCHYERVELVATISLPPSNR